MTERRGMIIELFGPAAAGKTTLAQALAAAFEARGIAARVVTSSRPAEQGGQQPEVASGGGVKLTAPLARASKLFAALGVLVAGASTDPLVDQLLETLPPKRWNKAVRARRYLRNLCRSWAAAPAAGRVVIFDQGFMNSLCSLALLSGRADRGALAHGLSLVPAPDLLVRVETPRALLEARLHKRLDRQSALERLFESDIETSLRQFELCSRLDRLARESGRQTMSVSWHEREGLVRAVEAITGEIVSRRGREAA